MSAEQNQIQLYVNLEPWALAAKEAGNSLNFSTYFDHLLRAVEIPMIQFLEQLHNEAALRAQNTSAATPREFQVLLREFVREPSAQRQQVFLEHLRNGKHSIEHLGTIALLAVRTLTQSLAGEDYELVALAQSQSEAARFYVQTGLPYAKLFLDAITEAARQMDRNPTYFSRRVKSKEYLENRAAVRAQIAAALRASINDIAIKAFSSLRQHIAERALQQSHSTGAMMDQQQQHQQQQQQQQQQRQTNVALAPLALPIALTAPQTALATLATPTTAAAAAPSVLTTSQQQQQQQPPPLVGRGASLSATPPLIVKKPGTATNIAAAEFDQRASPMSSNEAKLAQKDLQQS